MWANSVWGFFALSVTFGLARISMIWTVGHEEWGPRFLIAAVICFVASVTVFVWPFVVSYKANRSTKDFKKMAETLYPPSSLLKRVLSFFRKSDVFLSMPEAAQHCFHAVEQLPNAPRSKSSAAKTLSYYATLIKDKDVGGIELFGCVPGSRNKRPIPREELSQLYFLDENDLSKLKRLGNKGADPNYSDVSIRQRDLAAATKAIADAIIGDRH